MKVSKILKFVSLFIAVVAVYFFIQVSTNGDGKTGDIEALNSAVTGFISFTKVLLFITVLIVIAFMILDVIKHPAKLKTAIIGLVAFAIVIILAYVVADSNAVQTSTNLIPEGDSLSKNVSTGIYLSFFLGIIAFGGFLFDSIKSLIK